VPELDEDIIAWKKSGVYGLPEPLLSEGF